jgi:hypothetical protein
LLSDLAQADAFGTQSPSLRNPFPHAVVGFA